MVEAINHYAGLWWNWQWAMLWQTAILVAVVALADRLVRKWAWPQLRYALWLLVLVKLVLPPTLTSPLSVTSTVPVLAQEAMVMRVTVPPAADRTVSVAPLTSTGMATVPEAPPAPAPALAPIEPDPMPAALSWRAYLMGVWLLGVLSLGIGLLIYLRRLAVEHQDKRPDDVPDWFDEVLAQAATEIKLRRIPRVVFSTKVCCPAVFSLLRPVLLIPAEQVATMTRREARHILLHELAHIKRGDLLTHAVYMILMTLYWFNPLLWLIRKHMQNLRELCCDATVARRLREETSAYRDTLLDTGRALLARPLGPGLGLLGLFEDANWLSVRLHWLGKRTWRYPWLRRALVATVVALMLCCVLPMASLRADQDKATSEYKVTLANGTTIELVGLYCPTLNRWWRPDGTSLAEGPYDPNTVRKNGYGGIQVAVRHTNTRHGTLGHVYGGEDRFPPQASIPAMWYEKVEKAGQPLENITCLELGSQMGTEALTVKVKVAAGPWVTYGFSSRRTFDWETCTSRDCVFTGPYEREGKTYATVTHAITGRDIRLTVIDVNNVEHAEYERNHAESVTEATGYSQITLPFDIPLDDIAAIHLQTRPYTWIEFKNVSLTPDKIQDVQIVTTEPDLVEDAKEFGEVRTDIATFRDVSPMCLRAFHVSVTAHLDQEGVVGLPDRPWALKFYTTELDGTRCYFGPAMYVTWVGYFVRGGYRSLRPEHFRSVAASETPIIYSKVLLEAEGSKGTDVLFGDGRVEWVTADELSHLCHPERNGVQ